MRVWLPALLAAVLVGKGGDVTTAAATAATVGGIALAAGGLGPVAGGAISDRFGRAKSAIGIFALSGLLCLAIGWMYAAPWPLVVAVSCLLGWAISPPTRPSTQRQLLSPLPPTSSARLWQSRLSSDSWGALSVPFSSEPYSTSCPTTCSGGSDLPPLLYSLFRPWLRCTGYAISPTQAHSERSSVNLENIRTYQAVLFDFDDTLVDTKEALTRVAEHWYVTGPHREPSSIRGGVHSWA